MSDKGRLCHVCGRWIPEADDLVILRDGDGVAHLPCAWESKGDVTANALDEQDEAHRVELAEHVTRRGFVQVGDFVSYPNGNVRRVSHVWAWEGQDPGEWSVQTSDLGAGRYFLGRSGASYSGGLHPGVPFARFAPTNAVREGAVWFFRHQVAKAHGGVDCTVPFRVWTCEGDPS